MIEIEILRQGRKSFRIFRNKKDVVHLGVFALLGILFCQYTYFTAIEHSNAGTATILQYLAPVIMLMLICVRKMRKPNSRELSAIILSLLGTVILGTHGKLTELYITPEALFWGLAAAVASVCYNMLAGDLIKKYGTFQIAGLGMVFAGIFMCIIVKPWTYDVTLDWEMVLALVGVIVIGTALGNGAYLLGVSLVGPLKASLLASIEPVVSVAVSVVWLHTSFVWVDFLGFIMIISTVFVLSSSREKATSIDGNIYGKEMTQIKT